METMTPTVTNTLADAIANAAKYYQDKAQGRRYREDPVTWAKERINQATWYKQAEVMQSVVKHKRTAVKSGHGVGKSHLASVLAQWWIDTHIGEDVMIVTTAPSFDQVKGVLWEYIRKSHTQNKLPGTISEQAEWKDDDRHIIGIGRKPADGNMTSFQGRHYKYTLVIIDEACGIARELFTAVDAIATTDTCRVLAIGNPTDPNTAFGDIFLSNGGTGLDAWNKITISVLDNPNFTGEDVPQEIRDKVSSVQWVKDLVEREGQDSNDYLSRVLGEFPKTSEDSLFPIHLLHEAIDTRIIPMEGVSPVLGVDISRYGSDYSACVSNHQGKIKVEKIWRYANGPEGAQIIHEIAVRTGAYEVRIDKAGPGASVIDHLWPMSEYHYRIVEMDGSGMTPDKNQWLNARAFWHWAVKQGLIHKTIQLPSTVGDPDAARLFQELVGIRYMMNLTYGSLQIEGKENMRRRGVKSPDIADALMYAFAPLDMNAPLAAYGPGDVITQDAYDLLDEYEDSGFAISPI